VPGGADTVGQAGKDQPGEQRLGQCRTPGHRLSQANGEVTHGEEQIAGTLKAIAEAVENGVEVVQDHINEGHQGHGGQQEGDKRFFEVVPDAPEGVHG